MSKHKFTGDRSDMAHRIKVAGGRPDVPSDRRDYNEAELAMIQSGNVEKAKLAWHERKDDPSGR